MDISSAKVLKVIVHRVGNKLRDEGVHLSPIECTRSSTLDELLLRGLLAPVARNGQEFFLTHESDINLNAVNHYARNIFSSLNNFKKSSQALAKHLYSCSGHPNIGGGEFLIIAFDGIRIDGVSQQALGLFRIENKDYYLDVAESQDVIQVVERSGISLDKVQKGAIIMSSGFKVFALDNLGHKTKYWIENFLKAVPCRTPEKCAQIAGSVLKAISTKVVEPANALAFSQEIERLLDNTESFSVSNLRDISAKYINDDYFYEILNGANIKYGIDLDDEIQIESKKVVKYAADVVNRSHIAEGVTLLVSSPNVKISSVDVKVTRKGWRAVVDIEIKET